MKDIGEVFRNLGATKLLMAQLAEDKRYEDVIEVFFSYLEYIKNEVSTESAEMLKAHKYIENDHIDILTRTLLLMVLTNLIFKLIFF